MSEGKRIRWGNVARALAGVAAIAVVVAWPRMATPAPAVPDGVPVPAVSPATDGGERVARGELNGEKPLRAALRPNARRRHPRAAVRPSARRERHAGAARPRSKDRPRRPRSRRRGSRRPVRAPQPTHRPPGRPTAAPAPAAAPPAPAAPASGEFGFER